jgi:hypothetical protein
VVTIGDDRLFGSEGSAGFKTRLTVWYVSLSFPLTHRSKFNFESDKMRLQIPFIASAPKPLKYPESGNDGFIASTQAISAATDIEPQSLGIEMEPNSTT